MTSLKAEIKWSPGTTAAYDLWVNGQLEIKQESFAVVSNVKDSLLGFARGAIAEADEAAYEIRKRRNLPNATR